MSKKIYVPVGVFFLVLGIWLYASQTLFWQKYNNKTLGVSFKYPNNFKIESEGEKFRYPDGKVWYQTFISDELAPAKPRFSFEVNPDGYGPIFADVVYTVKQEGQTVEVIKKEMDTSVETQDGKIIILIKPFTTSHNTTYLWQFSSLENTDSDYQELFEKVIKTFRIL